jgi:hypothetical protein
LDEIELVKGLVGIGGIAVTIGLVKITKPFINDHRWYAPIALFYGIGFNLFLSWILGLNTTIMGFGVSIINGILSGLAGSGSYSGYSEIKKTKEEQIEQS